MSKLIIIRGQSGSGKSTIAKAVREILPGKTALIEQDYLRRNLLGEVGGRGDDNIKLIEMAARFTLENNYTVIIEGILHNEQYGEMLRGLIKDYPSFVYYIDVPLEETLIRHQSKPNKDEFGEEEMTMWYHPNDFLCSQNEVIINEDVSKQDIIAHIYREVSDIEE